MIQRRGRLRMLIPGYTCSHHLCIAQWASNWIHLSSVLSNIKEKTVTSLYFRYESYSRPTIHPTVTICILKIYQNHPHGEDLSYHQFCRWFESAARMIIGNLKNPACILKLFPPLFQSSHIRSLLIVKQSLLNFKLIRFSWYAFSNRSFF